MEGRVFYAGGGLQCGNAFVWGAELRIFNNWNEVVREGQLLWMGICVSWNLGEFSAVAVINNCHVVGEQER